MPFSNTLQFWEWFLHICTAVLDILLFCLLGGSICIQIGLRYPQLQNVSFTSDFLYICCLACHRPFPLLPREDDKQLSASSKLHQTAMEDPGSEPDQNVHITVEKAPWLLKFIRPGRMNQLQQRPLRKNEHWNPSMRSMTPNVKACTIAFTAFLTDLHIWQGCHNSAWQRAQIL